MMILAHRGMWKSLEDKNSLAAISRAFSHGYGLETDVRDHQGDVVISHDPSPSDYGVKMKHASSPVDVEWVLRKAISHALIGDQAEWAKKPNLKIPLAINIKSDGIGSMIIKALENIDIGKFPWFAFDMSVPEMVSYIKLNIPVFTRHSDIEKFPVLYDQAHGVWLDSFSWPVWYDNKDIKEHLAYGKYVCVVSPELHGHSAEKVESVWRSIYDSGLFRHSRLMICTDWPEKCRQFMR
ncbi:MULTISPECIES: PI-PLC domain-containing protein [Acetobacter]|uniref:Glycerophosphoryl diester phosphodiesterase n=2 Tax=Acetobacter TaxID=434 RepID=A0A401WY84_ACEPA|nr:MULTISPECIES: hypothetical protein [Acetobacter]PHY92824.1 hypothetical protein CSR02_14435 [Acetobacter pomorum]GBR52422.1 hypothetical protein AA11825_2234 [Acetobacter pomorum DSM 11825]GCD54281.1 hypothetical protein NBRC3188_2978 [Acetobacter pasteurianus NBRC 3188]